jgi:hypothetical protein
VVIKMIREDQNITSNSFTLEKIAGIVKMLDVDTTAPS